MLKVPQILVRAITLVGGVAVLTACGQKGALFLPTEAAARQRAPLGQVIRPDWARTRSANPSAAASPATAAPAAPPTQAESVPETTLQP